MSKLIPKYKIDSIVAIKDIYQSNPADHTTYIGKIIGINIKEGPGIFVGYNSKGITYKISGYGVLIPEESIEFCL